ncbi:hypothetical protein, variant 1 [Aphanomyces invadans]|uniref:TATA box binding protein associated factor (TAF) histone-like fold domain-containing protein n=1 Tax=Aphanomyces invadans TaxID=157072 RepID=A0A024TXS4_9STRA|nr:hypothetical protein, variant 1 [Aphanomyces invadans]ETV98945.1 hypothetical protein, variant 1 [Aphanomyces invadans]|eukprot:XP_008872372.1 hypothetical protein, variant 1 [Aphanomyces invadans]
MSVLREESFEVIAQSLGLEQLKPGCAAELAPEIEFRLREIIQDAMKFKSHARRDRLTSQDINHALSSRNMEMLYGYGAGTGSGTTFRKISPGLYITDEPEVPVTDIMNAPLPVIPLEPVVHMHWLAVEGVQPKITENDVDEPTIDHTSTTSVTLNAPNPSSGVERKPLVKHVLTDEMQLYFEKVTDAIKSDEFHRQQAAFISLTKDPGLHQLLPYFSKFIYDQVKTSQRDLTLLTAILRMARCLLSNTSLRIELYLEQLIPSILTCVLNRQLCENPADDHWAVRKSAAQLMAQICHRFGESYESLQLRVSKIYHEAFLDPTRPLTSQYGAIVGCLYLGPLVMESLLFPHIATYLRRLDPVLSPKNPNLVQRLEALHCVGMLEQAAGQYLSQHVKPHVMLSRECLDTMHVLDAVFGEALTPYICPALGSDGSASYINLTW